MAATSTRVVGRVLEARRVGRPARLSRALIVEAAHEVGLSGLTLQAVADRLGVTVPSLYHHVGGRDELVHLVAEQAARRSNVPVDVGQDWATWLREWATHIYRSFLDQPEMLVQYLAGSLTVDSVGANLNAVHEVMAREGFDIGDAEVAYDLVASYAIGAAVMAIQRERNAARGGPVHDPADELPHLERLVAHLASGAHATFDERLDVIIGGIAAGRAVSPSSSIR